MKLGFICLNLPGHLNPMTALARQLRGRNHEVVFLYSSSANGLPCVPGDDRDPENRPEVSKLHGDDALGFAVGLVVQRTEAMLKSMLDYVNSFAGTSLDISGLRLTIDTLSPLSNFEFQNNYFDNQNSALYYRTAFEAAAKFNMEKGVLPKGQYDADDLIWAADVYHDLVALKQAADDALKQIEGKSIPQEHQALVEKAKQFYGWYDYLDAYRLLRVVTQ